MGTHFARASAAGFRVLRAHQCVPYGGPERPRLPPERAHVGRQSRGLRRRDGDRNLRRRDLAVPPPVLPPLQLPRDAIPVRPEGGDGRPRRDPRGAPVHERARERRGADGRRGPVPDPTARVPEADQRRRLPVGPLRRRVRHPRERDRRPLPTHVSDHEREPVPPGTDGGVSLLGTLCALGAAVYTSVMGWFVLSYLAGIYGLRPTMPLSPG